MRTFTYDRVSNLKTRTDQKGQVDATTSTATSTSSLARDYPVSADDNMTYDLSGRMLTAERGGWLVTLRTYDGANRVTQTMQNGKTLSYIYNIPGRTRTVTYPGGRMIIGADRPAQPAGHDRRCGSPPPIVQYSYDLGNRVVRSRLPQRHRQRAYTYNANNWITQSRSYQRG